MSQSLRRAVLVALALAAVWLAAPTAAQARCCFELAVENSAQYGVFYKSDGLGYDGDYTFFQTWVVLAITSYRDGDGGNVKLRDGYSQVLLHETSTRTTPKAGCDRPCYEDRELVPCPNALHSPPSYGHPFGDYRNGDDSRYRRGAGLNVSRDGLYAVPPDDVYYSVEDAGCSAGSGHHGYGERAEGKVSARSVSLEPPRRAFLRTAKRGDRCKREFSSSLGLYEDHPGSDPKAPHTWGSLVRASYHLSYFPRRKLGKRRDRLAELDYFHRGGWGTDGTGDRGC